MLKNVVFEFRINVTKWFVKVMPQSKMFMNVYEILFAVERMSFISLSGKGTGISICATTGGNIAWSD